MRFRTTRQTNRAVRWLSAALFAMLLLGFASTALAIPYDIVIINNYADQPEDDYIAFLQDPAIFGQDCAVEVGAYTVLDQAAIDRLNAADLIIVSRATNSGDYANDATEIANWNAVQTPMLLHSAYLVRDIRWKWLPGGLSTPGITDITVIDPSDPIFNGVTLNGSVANLFSGSVNVSVSASAAAAGVNILATTDAGLIQMARWDGTESEYYTGSGTAPGGKRIWFGLANVQNSFPNLPVDGDGRKMLHNAMLSMLVAPAQAEIGFSPKSVDFGAFRPGAGLLTADITIGNNGAAGTILTVDPLDLTGLGDFQINAVKRNGVDLAAPYGTTLSGGVDTMIVTVSFQSDVFGAYAGRLSIPNSSTALPIVVSLAARVYDDHIILESDHPEQHVKYAAYLQDLYGPNTFIERTNAYKETLTPERQAELEAADLIIIARDTSSGSYDGDAAYWNSLNVPLMLHSVFLSRESHWKWTAGTGTPGSRSGGRSPIIAPHP